MKTYLITKTTGGFSVTNFKRMDVPIERHPCKPLIYSGLVQMPLNDPYKQDIVDVKWDEEGRCANIARTDCFINISDPNHEVRES